MARYSHHESLPGFKHHPNWPNRNNKGNDCPRRNMSSRELLRLSWMEAFVGECWVFVWVGERRVDGVWKGRLELLLDVHLS